MIASELMESGRAIQRGFATPDRTTLIASTSRVYSIDEKMALGDGRVDDDELLAAAERSSQAPGRRRFRGAGRAARLGDQRLAVRGARRLGRAAASPASSSRRRSAPSARASSRRWPRSRRRSTPAFAAAATVSAAGRRQPVAAADRRSGAAPRRDGRGRQGNRRRPDATRSPPPTRRRSWDPSLRELAERTARVAGGRALDDLHGLVRTAVYQDRTTPSATWRGSPRFAAVDPDATARPA